MKQTITNTIGTFVAILASIFIASSLGIFDEKLGAINPVNPQMTQASTTVFTLTTTSQRLLATTSKRVAAQIDVTRCTGGASGVYVRMSQDKPATTGTASLTLASSTESFGLTPYSSPIVTGAVTGITDGGTCTVLVTEWIDGQ